MYCFGRFCSVCANETNNLINIKSSTNFDINLNHSDLLQVVFPKLLNLDTTLPDLICLQCRQELNNAYFFQKKCSHTFSILQNYTNTLKTDLHCHNEDNFNLHANSNKRKREIHLGYNEETSRKIFFDLKRIKYDDISNSDSKSLSSLFSKDNLEYNLRETSVEINSEVNTVLLSTTLDQNVLDQSTNIENVDKCSLDTILAEITEFCNKYDKSVDNPENIKIEIVNTEASGSETVQSINQMLKSSSEEQFQQIIEANSFEISLQEDTLSSRINNKISSSLKVSQMLSTEENLQNFIQSNSYEFSIKDIVETKNSPGRIPEYLKSSASPEGFKMNQINSNVSGDESTRTSSNYNQFPESPNTSDYISDVDTDPKTPETSQKSENVSQVSQNESNFQLDPELLKSNDKSSNNPANCYASSPKNVEYASQNNIDNMKSLIYDSQSVQSSITTSGSKPANCNNLFDNNNESEADLGPATKTLSTSGPTPDLEDATASKTVATIEKLSDSGTEPIENAGISTDSLQNIEPDVPKQSIGTITLKSSSEVSLIDLTDDFEPSTSTSSTQSVTADNNNAQTVPSSCKTVQTQPVATVTNTSVSSSGTKTNSSGSSGSSAANSSPKHFENYKYQCKICFKNMRTQFGYNAHVYAKHTTKTFQCNQCLQTYRRQSSYIKHLEMHSRKKNSLRTTYIPPHADMLSTTAHLEAYSPSEMFRTAEMPQNWDRLRTGGLAPRCRNCFRAFEHYREFRLHIFYCNRLR